MKTIIGTFSLSAAALVMLGSAASASTAVMTQPQAHTGCLRPQVWGMINRLTSQIGPIQVTSACGGHHVRNSMHYRGLAIDFRPGAVSQSTAIQVASSDPSVGAVLREGRGLIHVDLGDRRPGMQLLGSWGGGTGHARRSHRRHRYAMR